MYSLERKHIPHLHTTHTYPPPLVCCNSVVQPSVVLVVESVYTMRTLFPFNLYSRKAFIMAGLFSTAGAVLASITTTADAVELVAKAGKYQAQRLAIASKISAMESAKELENITPEQLAQYQALVQEL